MILIAPRDCYVAVTGYDISITESTKWEKINRAEAEKELENLKLFKKKGE